MSRVAWCSARSEGMGRSSLPAEWTGTIEPVPAVVSVSRDEDLSACGFASRSSPDTVPKATRRRWPRRLGINAPPVRIDSQAKYALVARGEADIYLRLPTRADYREKIWDHAAGALIVAEAGGVVTDIQRPAARVQPRSRADGQPGRDRDQRADAPSRDRGGAPAGDLLAVAGLRLEQRS